jgi:23S rRNA (guanosine2251-2'-O)-methyltransferase
MKPPHSGRSGGPGRPVGPGRPGGPRRPEGPGGAGSSGGPRGLGGSDGRGPEGNRPPGNRPPGSRPPGSRPPGSRPPGNRPPVERVTVERTRRERSNEARLSLPRPDAAQSVATSAASGRPAPQRIRADLETPRGAVWLYGHHAVAAALRNPARRLRRLLLTEEAEAAIAAHLPQPWAIAPERTERGRLDHILGRDAVHQGAALLADPLSIPPIATALQRPGPVIVLDQVSDPRNVGAILRSAAAFGAAAVVAQERNAPDETGALAKAASGALETVPLLRAVNIARTIIALKAAGCWSVGLAADAQPLSGPALSGRRIALVLGAEGEGLRRLVRETCDEVAGIAMPGGGAVLDSLNVSAAAAIALYELTRR